MAFVLLVMGALGMLAHFVPVTLGLEADPSNTTYLPRPEWYFLPMFQWLKYWEGWRTVIGVFVIPLLLGALVFSLPFVDRGSERRPWRRPIPVGGVLIVLLGMMWLGMTSRFNDSRDPAVAAQLARQGQEEDAYFHAPFRPYLASSASGGVSSAPGDATVAEGKSLFDSHGCSGCHGASGGGAKAPALTHIATKYQASQLTALLKAPAAGMKAAGMVALTLDDAQFTALYSYLSSLAGAAVAALPATLAGQRPTAPTEPSLSPAGSSSASPSTVGEPLAKAPAERAIYESLGCAACHGPAGTGTQKAPALTDVGRRLSATQVASLLRTPSAKMKAGGMPAVTVGEQDLTSLVAYVRSLDSTGSPHKESAPQEAANSAPPPEPPTAPTPAKEAFANPSDRRGESVFKTHDCAACHGEGGIGTSKAPALTKLKGLLTPPALKMVLEHPTHSMQSGGMPAVKLASQEMDDLVAYLLSLRVLTDAPGLHENSLANTGDPAAGRTVYAHCAFCHGPTGKGDGAIGRVLRLAPTDFTTALSDDAEWLKVIEFGSRAAAKLGGMKGFVDELTDTQIRDVLAYVKTLKK